MLMRAYMTVKLSAYGWDASNRLCVQHLHGARELVKDPELSYKHVGAQKLEKLLASEAIKEAKQIVLAEEKDLFSWRDTAEGSPLVNESCASCILLEFVVADFWHALSL